MKTIHFYGVLLTIAGSWVFAAISPAQSFSAESALKAFDNITLGMSLEELKATRALIREDTLDRNLNGNSPTLKFTEIDQSGEAHGVRFSGEYTLVDQKLSQFVGSWSTKESITHSFIVEAIEYFSGKFGKDYTTTVREHRRGANTGVVRPFLLWSTEEFQVVLQCTKAKSSSTRGGVVVILRKNSDHKLEEDIGGTPVSLQAAKEALNEIGISSRDFTHSEGAVEKVYED